MTRILSWVTVIEKDEKRVFGLDLLRAIAILLVLVAHGKVFIQPFSGKGGFNRLIGCIHFIIIQMSDKKDNP